MAFPTLTGQVVDTADIFPPEAERYLTQLMETMPQHQMVIVTVKSLEGQAIEEYGYQLGRHWGIGEKGNNNGVLLIIAPNERLVRIEVGYGLEGALTDTAASVLINQYMMPLLKEGKYVKAATIGVQGIIAITKGEQFAPPQTDNSVGLIGMLLTVLIVGLFIYVAAAPMEDRARRIRVILFFLSFMPGRGGGGFRGKGGRFGGGGSTGKF